jgi:PAS domain S-box-containing protein
MASKRSLTMQPGHVLLDQQGGIVQADDSFGTLLLSPMARLLGRNVLSFTAPADRDECTQAIAKLRETGRPFDITKRFLREDDSVVWVRNSVSRMMVGDNELIVATCTPIPDHMRQQTPDSLLRSARRQVAMVEARGRIADPAVLAGPSWPALLEVYIAEAEGRAVNAAALSSHFGQGIHLTRRWIDLLVGSDILEVETRNMSHDAAKSYRLTSGALRRLEEYLVAFATASDAALVLP